MAIARAGSVSALAHRIGMSVAGVAKWERVPKARVETLALIYGIKPHVLRPDLFDARGRPITPAAA